MLKYRTHNDYIKQLQITEWRVGDIVDIMANWSDDYTETITVKAHISGLETEKSFEKWLNTDKGRDWLKNKWNFEEYQNSI